MYVMSFKNGKERWMTHLHWCQAVMGEILPALLLGVSLYVPPEQAVQTGKLFGFCREVKPTLFKTTTAIWKVRMLAKQFHDPNNVSLGELGKRQGCKKSYIQLITLHLYVTHISSQWNGLMPTLRISIPRLWC